MSLIIAPTEPPSLRQIGTVSLLPEHYGADILFSARGHLFGIQRKAVPGDLISSLHDGRLAEQLVRMRRLHRAMIILEGRFTWSNDGHLLEHPSFNFSGYCSLLWSLQLEHSAAVFTTDNLDGTIMAVGRFAKWAAKPSHPSLLRRPKVQGSWGVADGREWSIHLLQGFGQIGPQVAAAIFDHFGSLPMAWTCTEDDLKKVSGVGPKRARTLARALANGVTTQTDGTATATDRRQA